eukprot:TRINITY_DN76567_c0_g1_i1.p3 TRINITY_DN76567_c0_g1~~TRINITY_DN76567_c0_g1_i1.p3  ORF type:complete len:132 (+),score=5.18 TRINITY_DN76567_c0_g1_i1:145-540(+)
MWRVAWGTSSALATATALGDPDRLPGPLCIASRARRVGLLACLLCGFWLPTDVATQADGRDRRGPCRQHSAGRAAWFPFVAAVPRRRRDVLSIGSSHGTRHDSCTVPAKVPRPGAADSVSSAGPSVTKSST